MSIEKIIANAKENVSTISSQYEILLSNLKEAEGGVLHRNKSEKDITTGYGIYRHIHPKADIFKYIDYIASTIGITGDSSGWSTKTISLIANELDPDIIKYLSYTFYSYYLKNAHLELFTDNMIVIMTNLYTNSQKGAWMSIQEALRDMQRDGILDIPFKELSIVDGDYGRKTRDALNLFKSIETETDFEKILIEKLFRKSTLLAMKSYYSDLIGSNPDKFLRFIRGWDNRIEELEHA